MRICIVGCGAVGSLFAANLARLDDVEVWAYDPWQEHVDAINANGLRLSGAGEIVGRVRATSDPAALPPSDLGIFATKSMHTSAAAAATAHAFAEGAVCVFAQVCELGAIQDVVSVDQRAAAFAFLEAEQPIALLIGRAAGGAIYGLARWLPFVDAVYGSATYLPMADGARYEISITQSGLIARPLNQAAEAAAGAWR